MALAAEPVEGAAHVKLLLGGHVEEREVERGAARVAALRGYVLLDEEAVLKLARIEIALHQRVAEVFAPAHEVVDARLRAVGVVYLQAVAAGLEVVADGAEAVGGLAREQRRGLQVAVDARADEVVCAEIAYLQYGVGHHIGDVHEGLRAVGSRLGSVLLSTVAGRCKQRGHSYKQKSLFHGYSFFALQRYTFFS